LQHIRLCVLVLLVMSKSTGRVRTRSPFPVTVNTRVTRETQLRCQAAARDLGAVTSDIYRMAFEWWLQCYDAAGGRKLSDLEQTAALDSIKLVSSRLRETAAVHMSGDSANSPGKLDRGAHHTRPKKVQTAV
jgi:hypothetical protein